MNPFCLLSKGHTFKDMASRADAYKVLANSFPRFTTLKQTAPRPSPSATSAAVEEKLCPSIAVTGPVAAAKPAQTSLFEEPPQAVHAQLVETPTLKVPPVETARPPQPEAAQSPFSRPAPKPETKKKKFSFTGVGKKVALFCKRLVQRFVFGRKGRPVHAAGVQTELALEKVKVLRNNLNEDDLEVVLVAGQVGTGPEKPSARLSKMEMTGETWSRLTASFRKKTTENVFGSKAKAGSRPAHV